MNSKRRVVRSSDTKVRILDAAERLFAERGIEATSMRVVTSEAKVNLAAVNYHFGSKEGLIVAVYARRLGPVNEERLRLLDQLEKAGPAVRLEDVLGSYVLPVIRLIHDRERGGELFMRLLGRALYEPGAYLQQLFSEEVEPVLEHYTRVLSTCLPHLSAEDLFWRMHFAGGSLAYTLAQAHRLDLLSKGACDASDADDVTRRLVGFIAAGLRTQETTPVPPEVQANAIARSRMAHGRMKYRR